ncbi:MAG: cell division protein FtsA [Chloroflexota bacterium]|nr:cell division protein FtsA [Chloroflexota bacterium]MDE2958853.1 cell division protein FtsA [Chloroflexota bacterium]
MPQESMYAAVDIGTNKIISIVARLGTEGELKPLGTGVAPSHGVQQGVIDDFGEVKNSLQESMEECLRFVGRNPVDRYYVVVNGDHLVSSNSTEMLGSGEEVVTITEQRLRSLMSSTSGSLELQLDNRSEQTLHMIPMRYRLDGMTGVRNPTGLDTNELQLEAHIVRGMSVPLGNTARALQSCRARVGGMIAHPLASAEGVLTADEREMGVVVVDIGAGTIKTAVYREGTPIFSSVVPVGGNQLTRDLAVAMRIPYQMAEDLKVQFGHALPNAVAPNEEVLIPATQVQPRRMMLRRELCEPLYLRSLQMLKLISEELYKAEIGSMPPGGIVLTGGVCRMPGLAEMAARGLRMEVRLGVPLWYAGLPESLRQPEFSAVLGALQWAVKHRNRPDQERPQGSGERNWSPAALFRRPFARSGSRRAAAEAESEDE